MIPGLQTKLSDSVVASAATITVLTDIVRLTGSTGINTILSPIQGSPAIIFLIATDGSAIALGTSGNILVGQTLAQNRVYTLIWVKATGKWYIHGVV